MIRMAYGNLKKWEGQVGGESVAGIGKNTPEETPGPGSMPGGGGGRGVDPETGVTSDAIDREVKRDGRAAGLKKTMADGVFHHEVASVSGVPELNEEIGTESDAQMMNDHDHDQEIGTGTGTRGAGVDLLMIDMTEGETERRVKVPYAERVALQYRVIPPLTTVWIIGQTYTRLISPIPPWLGYLLRLS